MKRLSPLALLLVAACATARPEAAPGFNEQSSEDDGARAALLAHLLQLRQDDLERPQLESAGPPCERACALAHDICDLASRICAISARHADDDQHPAHAACQDGMDRCQLARTRTQACTCAAGP